MRTLSFITLVGAAMLVTHYRGANSFTLDRNAAILIDVDDSHETSTTMDLLDSRESAQNKTLTEDYVDSLEDDHLVKADDVVAAAIVKSPVGGSHVAISTETQQVVPLFNVHVRDSWDDLVKDLAKVDVPDNTQSTMQAAQVIVDHDDSLEDVLEKLAVQVGIPTSTEADSVESTTPDYDDSLEDVNIIQIRTSTAGQVPQTTSVSPVFLVDDDDDFSLEDHTQFINPDALQLRHADFHHLPVTLFSHPTSDDWFLVRQYMDDHFVWELGDELAKEYFWQPIKASSNLNLGSPVQIGAGNMALLTTVRSVWDDRLQVDSTAI